MAEKDDDTVGDFPAYQPAYAEATETICEGKVDIAALTHPGLIREKNEDHYAVLRRYRSSSLLASSLPRDQLPDDDEATTWMMVVADGLGGHASGEVASSTAVSAIVRLANQISSWIMRPSRDELVERVKLYADTIQEALSAMAEQNPSLTGMATTINALYLFGDEALVVNVGDSRAYHCRENKIQQITDDHTLAKHMEKEGVSRESTQRFRNLVTRSFNTDGKTVEFDMFQVQLSPGDHVLLCSDGLTDMVDDDLISDSIQEAESTKEACQLLLHAALEAGGRDNITTVLVRIKE
ncbi:MAG: protein phosphatase 2C domain-containing protein [Planctomycetota bacterium]